MLDQYKKIKISYEQLDQIQFNMLDPFILDVEWDEVHYEFLIRIKTNASNVLIFGSGAGGFQEQPIGPPSFIDILGWENLKIPLFIIMILPCILEKYL
ncbi:hypothetical protein ABH961_005949 [Bacillus sp. RC251]